MKKKTNKLNTWKAKFVCQKKVFDVHCIILRWWERVVWEKKNDNKLPVEQIMYKMGASMICAFLWSMNIKLGKLVL